MNRSESDLPTQSAATNTSEVKVLLLHDSLPAAEISQILNQAEFSVNLAVATTEEHHKRIEACLTPQLDVVLWDASQDRLTLSEAIDLLLKNNLCIPVLVINGEPSTSSAVAAIKAGATDYLTTSELDRLPQAISSARSSKQACDSQLQKYTTVFQQQLQKLITENADGIIVVDRQGIVQFVNPAAQQLLNKSSAELIGESLGFPVVDGDYSEVDIPQGTKGILVAQMRVSQIQWQKTDAYIVSLRDITRLKQVEEERVGLLHEAQAASRAKDEFLAVLSHELRTPLNPIVGWSQLLLMGNLSQAQVKKGIETIQRNAMLQAQLIEDILDISRIIRGKLKLEAAPVNLIAVIDSALDTVSLAAQAKSIQIDTNLDESVGLVQADSTRLQQVVWNLLSNAIKFTHNGGRVSISLTTTTKSSKPDGENHRISYAKIEVRDTGKGIDPEFLPYVFDYFRQAESGKTRTEGGLGLGLAIVRRLIELHGGEAIATSPGLGKGATFTVLLPILDNLEPSSAISAHSDNDSQGSSSR